MPLLSQQTLRRILALATLTLLSTTLALAQDPPSGSASPPVSVLVDSLHHSQPKFTDWSSLAQINPGGKLFVITAADPTHRHTCRVQSFTMDQLTCKGLGHRSYHAPDIAALIVPGEYDFKIRFVVGANAALGAAIWATVILTPVCPPCAVGTGIAALLAFSAAGAVLIGDDMPDALLYLAPNQTLHVDLRY